jgi:hypothetical protein
MRLGLGQDARQGGKKSVEGQDGKGVHHAGVSCAVCGTMVIGREGGRKRTSGIAPGAVVAQSGSAGTAKGWCEWICWVR